MKRSVLLLDEPTNHLDFETVEALGAALRLFQGTIFFISHDRTFVNLVASEIVEVKDGAVVRYPGSYAEYVYHLELRVRQELAGDPGGSSDGPRAARAPSAYHLRKQQASAARALAGRIKRSEEQQASYRAEKDALEAELMAHPAAWNRALTTRFEELTQLLQDEERRWIQLNEQLNV
jgi:ATP-binding cassette subfamily F protein 3